MHAHLYESCRTSNRPRYLQRLKFCKGTRTSQPLTSVQSNPNVELGEAVRRLRQLRFPTYRLKERPDERKPITMVYRLLFRRSSGVRTLDKGTVRP